MRRITPKLAALAVAALFAPVAVASPAHAKPTPDPLTALRKQFAAGGGVAYTSRTTLRNKRIATTTGAFRFGRSGLAASRLSTGLRVDVPSLRENPLLEALPEEAVKIGRTAYIHNVELVLRHRERRPWAQVKDGPATGLYGVLGQLVNPTEPATLKTLLAQSRSKRPGGVVGGTRTTLYQGKVTIGRLYRVSPWLRDALLTKPTPRLAKTTIDWKLYVGADGLPRRVVSSWSPAAFGVTTGRFTADSTFTRWGRKISIKPPADHEIIQMPGSEIKPPFAVK